jgi:hypothetical protein
LASGGKTGDKIRVIAECEKSECNASMTVRAETTDTNENSGENSSIYTYQVLQQQGRHVCERKPHKVRFSVTASARLTTPLIPSRFIEKARQDQQTLYTLPAWDLDIHKDAAHKENAVHKEDAVHKDVD